MILVTGAGGFIGSRLCHQFLTRGEAVTGLWYRDRSRLEDLTSVAGFSAVQGDIRHPAAWLSQVDTPDVVCHLAVQPPTSDETERTTNQAGTRALLKALTERGVRRWVYASTMSVYDFHRPEYLPVDEAHPVAPQQSYGEEKLQGERLFQAAADDVQTVTLRLAGIYGPRRTGGAVNAFLRRALNGQTIQIETDRQIDILHVEDAAQALRLAAERLPALCQRDPTRICNVGSGQPVALSRLAQLAGHAAGQETIVETGEEGGVFYMDISVARRDLNFAPMPLEQGLADVADWIRREEGVTP